MACVPTQSVGTRKIENLDNRKMFTAVGLGPHATDPRPHVVLIAAEQEYESQRTLPVFAKQYFDEKYRCTCLAATGPEGTGRDDVPGLAALYDADLVILSMRRRSLPVPQMDHLEQGHPHHPFSYRLILAATFPPDRHDTPSPPRPCR